VFLDPIFDVTKGGRETQTSTFQLAAAASYPTKCDVLAISFPKLSPDAAKSALRMRRRSPGLNALEVLTFANLAFPISTHVLVPKHTALSVDEAKAFETTRKITRDKLPLLKLSDPVRIWYGWMPNTIVRIDRPVGVAWRVVK
jgi:DNA-directed RNA polymerase subunit H (RpoH/RPB5)